MVQPNESLEDFAKYGYVLLRGAIKPEHLKDITRNLWGLVAAGRPRGANVEADIMQLESEDHERLYKASITVGSSLAAYELIASADLRRISACLLDTSEQHLHVTPLHIAVQIPRKTEFDYAWHIESDFYPWAPEIVNVWFPVLSSTERNFTGTIEVIPFSHLKEKRPNDTTHKDTYVQIVSHLDAEEESKGIQIEAEPGDALFFHKHMVHRTCPNLCNQPRVTGIVRVMDMARIEPPRPLYKAMSYVQ